MSLAPLQFRSWLSFMAFVLGKFNVHFRRPFYLRVTTIEWLPRSKDVQQAELRCVLCANEGEEFLGIWRELLAHLQNQHTFEERQTLLSLVTGTS